MKPRLCQWCGEEFTSAHPAKLYCSAKCKDDFGNFLGVVGKRIALSALAWRGKRGGKGVGSAALKTLCPLLDEANAQFAARAENAPSISEAYKNVYQRGVGITLSADR